MHFLCGAINKATGIHTIPELAVKSDSYVCPECNKEVIIRKGKIRVAHFSHKASTNPCNYYDRPNESQIHKEAKYRLKTFLENNCRIIFTFKCPKHNYASRETFNLFEKEVVITEFRDPKGSYVADLAIIKEDSSPKVIFEILYTHKTTRSRPEPWFEVNALDVLNTSFSIDTDELHFQCCRAPRMCGICINAGNHLGAFNDNDDYSLAFYEMSNSYKCLACKEPVVVTGKIFEHKMESSCSFYSYPSEEQLLKDAIWKLAFMIENNFINSITEFCSFKTWEYDTCDESIVTSLTSNSDITMIIDIEKLLILVNAEGVEYKIFIIKSYTNFRENIENQFYVTIDDVNYALKHTLINKDITSKDLSINNDYSNKMCPKCLILEKNLPKLTKVHRLYNPACTHSPDYFQTHECVQCASSEYSPIYYEGFRAICRECAVNLKEISTKPKCEIVDY